MLKEKNEDKIKIIDIQNMPNFNPAVKNGLDAVSKGEVYIHVMEDGSEYPYCKTHGAMIKVSKEPSKNGIWRCCVALWDHCDSGCYVKVEIEINYATICGYCGKELDTNGKLCKTCRKLMGVPDVIGINPWATGYFK